MYTTLFYTYTLVPLRSLTPSFPSFVPPPPPPPRLTDILYYWPTGQFARSLNLFLTAPLSNTHSLSHSITPAVSLYVLHWVLVITPITEEALVHSRDSPRTMADKFLPLCLSFYLCSDDSQLSSWRRQWSKVLTFCFCVSAQETMAKSGDCFCSDKSQLSLYRKQCLKVVIVSVSAQMEASCLYTDKNG